MVYEGCADWVTDPVAVGFDRVDEPKRSIVLIGMMGCGKSTIGRLIAERFGWEFVDTDARIESEAGCSIRDVFARFGEAYFRRLESQAISRLADSQAPRVIAVGGGAVLRDDNLARLRRIGTMVYLKVTPQELARRVGSGWKRPLVARRRDKAAALAELLERREPRYEMADVIICTDGLTVPQAVRAVIAAVEGFETRTPEAPPDPPARRG